MLLDAQFPPDIRVENEARSLVSAGYDLHLLTLTHSKQTPLHETWQGVNLERLYVAQKSAKRGRGLINTILDFYTHFWAAATRKFIEQNQLDALHVHDLYLLGAAFAANKYFNLPVIADLHENYVAGLKYYRFANTFPGNWLISQKKWAQKEIEWCRKADFLVTVIEEAVDRYAHLGIPHDKIHVVANYVNVDEFLDIEDDHHIVDRFKDNITATYIGGFDTHRGLETIINATPAIITQIPEFRLLLVGRGRNFDELRTAAKRLNISDHVIFEGYQPPHKVPSYIKASTLGLIPHLKTEHTDNTIPHKLFHYMLLGKPVVATNCAPLKRIVESTKSGIIFTSNDHHDFTHKIVTLVKNRNEMRNMGQNGMQAVKEKYNWTQAQKPLLTLYQQILKAKVRSNNDPDSSTKKH